MPLAQCGTEQYHCFSTSLLAGTCPLEH